MKNQPAVSQIQRELADERKDTTDAAAGEYTNQQLKELARRHQTELKELREGMRQDLEEVKRDFQEKVSNIQKDSEGIVVNYSA